MGQSESRKRDYAACAANQSNTRNIFTSAAIVRMISCDMLKFMAH